MYIRVTNPCPSHYTNLLSETTRFSSIARVTPTLQKLPTKQGWNENSALLINFLAAGFPYGFTIKFVGSEISKLSPYTNSAMLSTLYNKQELSEMCVA